MPTGHPADVDQEEIVRLYCVDGLSCNQIAQRLGVSERVPYLRLKWAGVQMRTRAQALGQGRMTRAPVSVDAACRYCGVSFSVKPHELGERLYCSRRCAGLARTSNGLPVLERKVTVQCAGCGQPFACLPNVARRGRKYCSRACLHHSTHKKRRSGQKRTLERIVEALLVGLGLNYEHEWAFGRYSADFYLLDYQRAVECDGTYWHALPTTVRIDGEKERAFREASIPVLHLTESEVYADIADCRQRLLSFINTSAPD